MTKAEAIAEIMAELASLEAKNEGPLWPTTSEACYAYAASWDTQGAGLAAMRRAAAWMVLAIVATEKR